MNNIFTTHSMHGTAIHQIVEVNPTSFYTRELSTVWHVPPTADELAEMAKLDAEYESYSAEFGHYETFCCYPTPQFAQRAAELHALLSNIDDDIRAFHAPSECYDLACRGPARELEALEALANGSASIGRI